MLRRLPTVHDASGPGVVPLAVTARSFRAEPFTRLSTSSSRTSSLTTVAQAQSRRDSDAHNQLESSHNTNLDV